MVRIVNYQKRQTEQGKEFFVLEIQGGIEMVKSQETGKMYITARKASIASTFDELTCQALLGTELPGDVRKVECAPYDYTVRDTGEIITLTHRFEYVEENAITQKAEKSPATMEEFMTTPLMGNSFSANGQLVH